MTQRLSNRTRLLALLAFAAVLAGCESLPGASTISEVRAERMLASGDAEGAAAAFLTLAGEVEGYDRSRLLLRAADAYIEAGDAPRAELAVQRIAQPVGPDLYSDWRLTRAAIANLRDDGKQALSLLSEIDTSRISLAQRIRFEGERGTALFLTGNPGDAVTTLARREIWLNAPGEFDDNAARIWDGLLRSQPEALRAARAEAVDRTVRGWLDLGLLFADPGSGGPQRGLAAWRRQYPGHPALATIVAQLGGTGEASQGQVRHIALIVTLSGRAAAIGEAVRDGFLGHYATDQRDNLGAPTVSVYDIAETGATRAYQLAIDNGADFVVGPILPSAVDELSRYDLLSVPTLVLNYVRAEDASPLLYQFGLAPEDEAAAAARRALGEGHRRVVAFAPASDWGERVLAAFEETFSAYGGVTLDAQRYIASETDYSSEIEAAMLLDDSVTRYREVRRVLAQPLQFEPRRRADVDAIFMAASTESGERLKPQFRFHYSGDLPVYATSAVNSAAETGRNSDLTGVRFTEIPWLTAQLRDEATPLDTAARRLNSARRQPRLFALGHDAYGAIARIARPSGGDTVDERSRASDAPATTTRIGRTSAMPSEAPATESRDWPGATGILTLKASGNIRRSPEWAVFAPDGVAALPPLDPRALGWPDTAPTGDWVRKPALGGELENEAPGDGSADEPTTP